MVDKKYLRTVAKYVLTTVCSVCIALYVGYHLTNVLSSSVTTSLVTYTEVRDTQSVDGYIMRSETLLYADGQGNLNYLAEDGEKVGISQQVVELYDSASAQNADQSAALAEIDRRTELLKNSNLGIGQTYSDTAVLDDSIGEAYYDILCSNAAGDSKSAVQKRDNFLSLLNQRQIVTGMIENYDAQIEALERQRDELIKTSGNVKQWISAPASGYYYSDLDGFEDIFSANKVDSMTLADFDEMVNSTADQSLYQSPETGGRNAGKIVDEFTWYVACRIRLDELQAYNLNAAYRVVFPYNGDQEVLMRLDRIVQESGTEDVVLIFASEQVPDGFNFLRRQSIEIVRQSATGYRIPSSAVRMENNVQGVYILDGYTVRFRPIIPVLEVDNYLIVSAKKPEDQYYWLEEFDAVIVSGKNLYDGKVIS